MWHAMFATVFLALALLSAASPITLSACSTCDDTITEAKMVQIAPNSTSCDDPPAKGECATASQAAKFVAQSFENYDITSKAEQAAIISLMAFESDDFKYNKNHFPGVAGQGTRNMQSPAFNKKYAASIPALKDQVAKVSDSPADLLDLLRNNGTYDFGSGAWFLTTQCSKDVRSSLQAGTEAGWKSYISDCVGTSVTDDRKKYWERAVKALCVKE